MTLIPLIQTLTNRNAVSMIWMTVLSSFCWNYRLSVTHGFRREKGPSGRESTQGVEWWKRRGHGHSWLVDKAWQTQWAQPLLLWWTGASHTSCYRQWVHKMMNSLLFSLFLNLLYVSLCVKSTPLTFAGLPLVVHMYECVFNLCLIWHCLSSQGNICSGQYGEECGCRWLIDSPMFFINTLWRYVSMPWIE